jgi:penicillin-binding protein 1C
MTCHHILSPAAAQVAPTTVVSRLGATVVSAADIARLSLPAPGAPPLPAKDPALRVTSPHHGAHVLADPETPRGMATLALEVRPRVSRLVWYVDGAPFAVADYPYTARWPLRPGEHRFEARLPYAPVASAVVSVRVE